MCICIYGKSSRFVSTVTTIMANVDLFIRNQRAKLDSERAEFTSETSNVSYTTRASSERRKNRSRLARTRFGASSRSLKAKRFVIRFRRSSKRQVETWIDVSLRFELFIESSPAETGLKLGQYEDKQKLLREERKKEYQQYLAKVASFS